MSTVIAPTEFEMEFNTSVKNVAAIIREARHMSLTPSVYSWLTNFIQRILDDMNFKVSFIAKYDQENYIKSNLLDMMDALKDSLDDEHCVAGSNDYKVINSVYDVIKGFYFNID